MASWYVSSAAYAVLPQWASSTAYVVGNIVKQASGASYANARVFRCTTAGTSRNSEPAWNLTKASTTAEGGPSTLVWTEVTGNSAYGWTAAAPYFYLIASTGWSAAGDTVYVSNNHAESRGGNIDIACSGTVAAPLIVLCSSDAAAPPTALASTATITTTTANRITLTGSFYIYGITFKPGNETAVDASFLLDSSATAQVQIFDTCGVYIPNGANSAFFAGSATAGASSHIIWFINGTLKSNNTGCGINAYNVFFSWMGGTYTAGTAVGTNLIRFQIGYKANVLVSGVDLSAISGATKYLVLVGDYPSQVVRFCGCKLAAVNPTVINGTINSGETVVILDHCDNGSVNTRTEMYKYGGSQILSTATYRTGGASDGTTSFSYNFTTLATGPSLYFPFKGKPEYVWLDTTGAAKTIEMEILHDSLTNLKDSEVWIEVEYLGTAANPQASYANDRVASILATPADQTASVAAWTNAMANPNKQKVSVSITNQLKGYFCARVCVAKTSKTVYVCPKVTVT